MNTSTSVRTYYYCKCKRSGDVYRLEINADYSEISKFKLTDPNFREDKVEKADSTLKQFSFKSGELARELISRIAKIFCDQGVDASQRNTMLRETITMIERVEGGLAKMHSDTCLDLVEIMLEKAGTGLSLEQFVCFMDRLRVEDPSRVAVDSATLSYLDISREDPHPSMIKGVGKSKEGYTLLNRLTQYLSMSTSRNTLKNLVVNPLNEPSTLMTRHQRYLFLSRLSSNERYLIGSNLKKVNAFGAVIERVALSNMTFEDWTDLGANLANLSKFQSSVFVLATKDSIYQRARQTMCPQIVDLLDNLAKLVSATVDARSKDQQRGRSRP